MPDSIIITGGVRSGKSSLALSLTEPPRLFVATASPHDREMRERITRHQAERGREWDLLESPLLSPDDLRWALSHKRYNWVVVDCVTIWVSNMVLAGGERSQVLAQVEGTLEAVNEMGLNSVWVSSEVGMGLVPTYPLGRFYRDLLGEVNKLVASQVDTLYLMVAGNPLKLK